MAHVGSKEKWVSIVSAGAQTMALYKLGVDKGRALDADDRTNGRRVCVIGENLNTDLFGGKPVDDTMHIKLGDELFTVVGVLAHKPTMGGSNNNWAWNNKVLLPETTYDATYGAEHAVGRVYGRAATSREGKAAARATVMGTLLRRHFGVLNFKLREGDAGGTEELILMVIQVLLLSTGVLALIASGINIMNVMLVSVSERRREIGLRRAIGATPRSIMVQFLLEATALSTAGGVLGVGAGVAVAWVVALVARSSIGHWNFELPLWSFAVGVGPRPRHGHRLRALAGLARGAGFSDRRIARRVKLVSVSRDWTLSSARPNRNSVATSQPSIWTAQSGRSSRPTSALPTFARGVVRSSPDALRGLLGHRLVWVRGASFGGLPLLTHQDAFAVVGRHTQCGMVLANDSFVALRHVLVRSIALPNGKAALRILDLHTLAGFMLADGSRQKSVFAEGPVAVGIGEYALVALPGEAPDDALPADLPKPEIEAAGGPYRVNARPRTQNRMSRITLMPQLLMLGEAQAPNLARLTGASARWAVTLERNGRQATVSVTEQDLAAGVVIGRSEKCHSEDLRRITDNNTSRVHVLILRENDRIQAFDLASTQGMYLQEQQARRVDLQDTGTFLRLSKGKRQCASRGAASARSFRVSVSGRRGPNFSAKGAKDAKSAKKKRIN